MTILTPTYNRVHLLPRLYQSLCAQSNFDFEWLIIDDGSTDETSSYIASLTHSPFPIHYYKKENGGKHTALNFSHPYIQGTFVGIVDSDDWLVSSAVETIHRDWDNYAHNTKIGVISYLRQFNQGGFMSLMAPTDPYLSNHIKYRINQNVSGDQFEVVRTSVFTQYKFPVFTNEHFMPEGSLWGYIALHYQTVYRNVALYCGDYLPDGLTKAGRALRLKNPQGMFFTCIALLNAPINWKKRIKLYLLLGIYGLSAKYSLIQMFKQVPSGILLLITLPASAILFVYWKVKYLC